MTSSSSVKISQFEVILLLALLNSLTIFSTDALLPVQLEIGAAFNVFNRVSLQYIIAAMFIGMGFGEWFAGPISDAKGRRFAMHSGMLLFLLGTVIVLIAPNFTVLIVGRFLQGVGLALVKISSRAMIRDLYSGDEMARVTSFMTTIFIFVPMVAPIIGEWMNAQFGWRAIVWFWLVSGAALLIWFFSRQTETLKAEHRQSLNPKNVVLSAITILQSPSVFGVVLALGCMWGAQLLYLTNAKSIYADIFSIHENIGLVLAIVASSIGLSALINGYVVRWLGAVHLSSFALLSFTVLSVIDLSLYVFLNDYSFLFFVALSWLKFFSFGFVFGNLNAIGMRSLGRVAGLGSTLLSALSSLVGLLASSIIGFFYSSTLTPILTGMVVLGVCAVVAARCALPKGTAVAH